MNENFYDVELVELVEANPRREGRSTRNQWPHFRYARQTDRVR